MTRSITRSPPIMPGHARARGFLIVAAMTLILSVNPVRAAPDETENARATAPPADGTAAEPGGLNDFQLVGYGCIVGTAAMMAITAAVGPVEVVQIFAGGTLVPSSPMVLWTSLAMGAGAQTCAAAGLATPALIHAWGLLADIWHGASSNPAP